MQRVFLIAAVVAVLATTAHAQPLRGEPPNPDADHDGKVTLSEFKALETGRRARMFARMDANKDGKITAAEIDAARKHAEAEGRGPPRTGSEGGPRGGFMMRMDANQDGAVTKAEMGAMTQRRFEMADTNHDGWLSKGELLMMRQRMRGGPGQP
jgi:hypothetical protein